ncbi:UHRF1-like protein, partial [Mya arenaria]
DRENTREFAGKNCVNMDLSAEQRRRQNILDNKRILAEIGLINPPSVLGSEVLDDFDDDEDEENRIRRAWKPTVAGIHGGPDGAYSIALSGGYDDNIDLGECFTYTGEGGRDLKGTKTNPKNLRTAAQSKDQTLTRGNLALSRNVDTGNPVRVIRGYKLPSPFAPEEGYRYDGLYSVEKAWYTAGQSGFMDGEGLKSPTKDQTEVKKQEDDTSKPSPRDNTEMGDINDDTKATTDEMQDEDVEIKSEKEGDNDEDKHVKEEQSETTDKDPDSDDAKGVEDEQVKKDNKIDNLKSDSRKETERVKTGIEKKTEKEEHEKTNDLDDESAEEKNEIKQSITENAGAIEEENTSEVEAENGKKQDEDDIIDAGQNRDKVRKANMADKSEHNADKNDEENNREVEAENDKKQDGDA